MKAVQVPMNIFVHATLYSWSAGRTVISAFAVFWAFAVVALVLALRRPGRPDDGER